MSTPALASTKSPLGDDVHEMTNMLSLCHRCLYGCVQTYCQVGSGQLTHAQDRSTLPSGLIA